MQRDKRGRLVCVCGGYWFPHRHGGGACEHSRMRDVCLARRQGDRDALIDALLDLPAQRVKIDAPCPF